VAVASAATGAGGTIGSAAGTTAGAASGSALAVIATTFFGGTDFSLARATAAFGATATLAGVAVGAGFAAVTGLAAFAASPASGHPYGWFCALTGSVANAPANTKPIHARVVLVIVIILVAALQRRSLNTPPRTPWWSSEKQSVMPAGA